MVIDCFGLQQLNSGYCESITYIVFLDLEFSQNLDIYNILKNMLEEIIPNLLKPCIDMKSYLVSTKNLECVVVK